MVWGEVIVSESDHSHLFIHPEIDVQREGLANCLNKRSSGSGLIHETSEVRPVTLCYNQPEYVAKVFTHSSTVCVSMYGADSFFPFHL